MPPRPASITATSLLSLVTGPVRARRWWLRVLVKVTGGSIGVLLIIASVVAYLITLRPDVPAARALSQRELRILLEPAEQVKAAAWARRRAWWDGFRETYGTLAITDRRLLFVGIPPRELVSPERGPQPFVILQMGRDETLRALRTRVDLGTAAGVTVENDRGALAFASSDAAGVANILAEVKRSRTTGAATVELARRTRAYEQRVTGQAVWHVVGPGDALSSIAARYGTTDAQLTALNRLTGTKIRIGQRLQIKVGR